MGLLKAATCVRILSIAALAGLFPAAASDPLTSPDEYEVKAAFLVGFARFMEHPDTPEVVLCTAGDLRISEALKRTAAGKTVDGKPLSVRVVERKDAVAGCSILFVGSQRLGLLREVSRDLEETRVLTVGDGPGFLDFGGGIEFIWASNKIQYNASIAVIQRSGAKVNSRLLSLARNLRNSGRRQ
jgi:hypothetical protein